MLPNVHETTLSIDHDVTDLASEVRFRLRHELVCTTSTSLITEDVKMTTNTSMQRIVIYLSILALAAEQKNPETRRIARDRGL